MNTANHTAKSWGAGTPSTKQGQLGQNTNFAGFRYFGLVSATFLGIMLKIGKNRS